MDTSKQKAQIIDLQAANGRRRPGNRLAALKQSEQWNQLSRQVQRSYERREHQFAALIDAGQRHDEAMAASRQRHLAAVATSAKAWQEEIDGLDGTISEEERAALILAKSNELAALLSARQTELDCLNQLYETDLAEVLNLPPHEWVKPTVSDQLAAVVTLGEAELARRGLPPLSFMESLVNTISLGLVADKRLRDAERARTMPVQTDDRVENEEQLYEADYTLK